MWIECHDTVRDHPKILKLSRDCDVTMPHAVGLVVCLWTWVLRFAPDGDLRSFDRDDLELGAMWAGEPGLFVRSCINRELIDESEDGLSIHDWCDFSGSLKAADRARAYRARKAANTSSRDNHKRARDITLTDQTDRPDQTDQTPDVTKELAHLLNWGEESKTIADTITEIATTRKSGRISDSVRLGILRQLYHYREKLGPDFVVDACKIYTAKGYAGQGKGERYLYGIIRNEHGREVNPKPFEAKRPTAPPGMG